MNDLRPSPDLALPLSSLLEAPETDLHPDPNLTSAHELTRIDNTDPNLTPTQNVEIAACKAYLADTARPVREPHYLSVRFRHSGWHADRVRIYEALERTEQPLARKLGFLNCGAQAHILRNVEDPTIYRVAGSCCHDRFCLPCANERSHAIALNVLDVVKKRTLRFLTLTVKSDAEPLSDLLDKLHNSFQKLRRTKLWKKCVDGGVAFLEINWSEQRQRWHPHFHILIEGRYLPYAQLKSLWLSITGDSFVIEIRIVRDAPTAARYVTKYASKPFNKTFLHKPRRLDEAIVALKGRKLLVTFGTWRGITLARTPTPGAWENIGSLERYIQNAAAGDPHAKAILSALTDQDLEPLYARAPPLTPTGPDRTVPDPQATWLGTWQRDGTWRNRNDP